MVCFLNFYIEKSKKVENRIRSGRSKKKKKNPQQMNSVWKLCA